MTDGPDRFSEAAFFDLDKTVIAKAAMLAFGPSLQRAGMLNRWLVARALWGQVVFRYLGADESRMQKMRETALRIATGWDQNRISALVDDALTEIIDPLVYAEAVELIDSHRAAGRRVYLVSASPEEIVLPLARHLGVHDAIATRAEIDPDGRYTGGVEFYSAGDNKVTAIREKAQEWGHDLENSFAYSDSITDLPMLECVGHPVAVNPDRALLREALSRGWEIRTFEISRPLRPNRTFTPPKPAAFAMSAAAASAVALGLIWRYRDQTSRILRASTNRRPPKRTARNIRFFVMPRT